MTIAERIAVREFRVPQRAPRRFPIKDRIKELARDLAWAPARRQYRLARARRLAASDTNRFVCPICGYRGIFTSASGPLGGRKYGTCPDCGNVERQRLQIKVLETVLPGFASRRKAALHFAPEAAITRRLSAAFGLYRTTDLTEPHVDFQSDMRDMNLPDAAFDFIYASHVLEHIEQDRQAIREVFRVLRPGGIAVLPVPIVAPETIEYPGPIASEHGHVRGPGLDYFDRYREVFDEVTVYSSADFPGDNQLFIYEDRLNVPESAAPYRPPMAGTRHPDYVPVCRKLS